MYYILLDIHMSSATVEIAQTESIQEPGVSIQESGDRRKGGIME
jgi:hypothetical protein